MTNKEAIFKLIEYCRWLERNFERFNAEPFDKAIGALEDQEAREQYKKWEAVEEEEAREYFERTRQTCEDCISRESVIEWLKDKDIIKTKNQEENARKELANLPSVTPQPKICEWLKNGELCKCSNCHSNVLFSAIKYYNYCYHCGAKMQEVKE